MNTAAPYAEFRSMVLEDEWKQKAREVARKSTK